ncbi:hypothetical protein CAPTEDRAFT_195460 [Capitella teleta]|nr:hypothetical protein CAPTEDRAFT_195460 [Capitella teleta]|eukprot:ELT91119.1 hypothetical protein CAPTEDRAFT_195460 [Capitella teleta]
MPTPSPPQLDRSVSCIPPDFPTETLEGSGGSTLSHGFAQALQTTPFDVQTLNTMDEADLLKIQAEYFERLKLQLMEQQKQQISVLLSQQREQQMALQQSIIASHQASTTLPKPILVQKKKDSHQSEDLRAESAPIPSVHFSVNSHIAASHAEDSFNRSLLSDASVLIHAESPTKVQSATKSPRLGVRHSYDRHPVKARSRLLQPKDLTPELQRSFEKLSALAKGHLTRLLMKSDRVQTIIKTITDTAEFALNFQKETPIKKGHPSQQDRLLQKRLIAQLTAAMYEIHEVFFETSLRERLLFIAQTRQRKHEQFIREQVGYLMLERVVQCKILLVLGSSAESLSYAWQAAEASMLESDFRPKSAPPKSSSPVCPQRNERSAIARNYKHLMAKAMKASQSAQHSPIKPVKDNLNRAARDKQTTDVKRHMTSKTNGVNTGKKPGPLRKIARPSVPTQANGHR